MSKHVKPKANMTFGRQIILAACHLVFIHHVQAQWDLESDPQWDETELSRSKRQAGHIWPEADTDKRYPGHKDIPICPPNDQYCWTPPHYPYDPIVRSIRDVGLVVGRSLMYRDNPKKYVNIFLGIPYAKMPIEERRFKPPEEIGPNFDLGIREYDASFYRDACPQELWLHGDKYYEPRNMSENCLHLNIFQPNLTMHDRPPESRLHKVMVLVHGDDFRRGDSLLYPGHILAQREMIVITFDYRLGALGFLSTMDNNAKGNYGLMDILFVLKWIRKHIREFDGDRDQVTLVGVGSGAAAVALLLLSPQSKYNGKPLFHQAALMGGSDLCEWSFVDHVYLNPIDRSDPLEYARDLGRQSGCDPEHVLDNKGLVDCLRRKHYDEIVNGTASVYKKYGTLSGPFGPVVDGIGGVLPRKPEEIRQSGDFLKMRIVAGLNRDEGAFIVDNITKNMAGVRISEGLDPTTFRDIIRDMIIKRPGIRNIDEVVNAIEFEYTFWAKPDNRTAVRQNLIDLWSDMMVGSCVDATLKSHAAYDEPVFMYTFHHRSLWDVLPEWMGTPQARDVDYLFGQPFFNTTLGNITGVVPDQWDWTILDQNMSSFMQNMWANFTKYNHPTTEWERNVTWYPFALHNLSYLHIGGERSYMDINYRQSHYAFWREYFPAISQKLPVTTTPFPTPHPLIEYQIATWCLVGAAVITICIIVALAITLRRRMRS